VLYDGLSNTLKQREKCIKAAAVLLEQGTSVVVGKSLSCHFGTPLASGVHGREKSKLTRGTRLDNTNADPATRAVWVNLAKETNVPIRCIHFTAGAKVCEHNDTVRALNRCPEVSRSASSGAWRRRLAGRGRSFYACSTACGKGRENGTSANGRAADQPRESDLAPQDGIHGIRI
jgi:hypothetical protein